MNGFRLSFSLHEIEGVKETSVSEGSVPWTEGSLVTSIYGTATFGTPRNKVTRWFGYGYM